ncbi:MAG: flagellar export protein FliJ [Candidatus Sumerlaeia bacterium]
MPFKFSLEAVLDYRKRMEESRQRDFMQIQSEVDRIQSLLDQGRENYRQYQRDLNRIAAEGKGYAHQKIYMDYLQGLERLMEKTQLHLDRLRAEAERRRELLEYALRQRRIMDELKKEEYKEYQLEERRAETREFDEIAIRKFARQKEENFSRREDPIR